MEQYPKRLIEVDLPIKRISIHARREKSIRHGHISTLHIWWARRPLAACRAVICASLWPDPADELCPEAFREAARRQMGAWAESYINLMSQESENRFLSIHNQPGKLKDNLELRYALFDFIADFANWDNSTRREYLETSRLLTQSAHESLGGLADTKPLVVDPFAGGGSIPLEALRVGADAFASDLNPVAVLLNKVILEYIPKYGQTLADEVRKWGEWVKQEAEKELAEFYPKDPDGATPIAYLWARTIRCEGPGCGAEVPLMRSLWLAKRGKNVVGLRIIPKPKLKKVDFEIINNAKSIYVKEGTVKRGSATCPCCGYTTPVTSVRKQLKARRGGTDDARLYCVVTLREGEIGRNYRIPFEEDYKIIKKVKIELNRRKQTIDNSLSLIPDEATPDQNSHRSVCSARVYGMDTWADIFSPRQALSLIIMGQTLRKASDKLYQNNITDLRQIIQTIIAFAFDKQADLCNSLCRWEPNAQCPRNLFGRQAIPMVWDFAEGVPIGTSSGSWIIHINGIINALENLGFNWNQGNVTHADATSHPLPNDIAHMFFTDPPYYDAVPYAEVSDFFYVWLKRNVPDSLKHLFKNKLTQKTEQAIVWHPDSLFERNAYEIKMKHAMSEGKRILNSLGIGIVVFAHKTTTGWEAQLISMIEAGWIITASWPVDTECGSRMNAMGTASLASSIHLVCRPRHTDEVGDWRTVLSELPKRIHDWMPRLAEEGVVGADAIFACLGPGLEIFSRYSRVEKASGEVVTLKEYLEQVWAAVAREALSMIFASADTAGFEEDARLTAMWLWTLKTADIGGTTGSTNDESNEEEESCKKSKLISGFTLEYDAARKIAQGLGAYLENLKHLVLVKGETAILLPVNSRNSYLFGKEEVQAAQSGKRKRPDRTLFDADEKTFREDSPDQAEALKSVAGKTLLDQLHMSMLLFAANRSTALKRFLVDGGTGSNPLFWKLAQALSALYPTATDEKRWVDGVLARKKGLGF